MPGIVEHVCFLFPGGPKQNRLPARRIVQPSSSLANGFLGSVTVSLLHSRSTLLHVLFGYSTQWLYVNVIFFIFYVFSTKLWVVMWPKGGVGGEFPLHQGLKLPRAEKTFDVTHFSRSTGLGLVTPEKERKISHLDLFNVFYCKSQNRHKYERSSFWMRWLTLQQAVDRNSADTITYRFTSFFLTTFFPQVPVVFYCKVFMNWIIAQPFCFWIKRLHFASWTWNIWTWN